MGGCRRITNSAEETAQLGVFLGTQIHPGDVILLFGDYGVGKTEFIRGVVRGYLGEDAGEQVASPSFALLHTYARGNRRFCHYDFYRLGQDLTKSHLNLFQEVEEEDVVGVEWPGNMPIPRFRRVIKISISIVTQESREIDIKFLNEG